MTIFAKRLTSLKFRKWFLVLSTSILVFLGLEALSYLSGIFQLPYFINISVLLYVFVILISSLIFDFKLKIPKSWERSSYYYFHAKHRLIKIVKIIARAARLRFHYLFLWKHWRHYQNFLILPTILYWSIIILMFLNPFDYLYKQIFIAAGTFLIAIAIWHLKTVFISYSQASINARYLMFAATIITAFLSFTAALGLSWYFGFSRYFFPATVFIVAFLLMYQSLYHHALLDIRSNIKFVSIGAGLCLVASFIVEQIWTVNYFSAGLLLAGILHLYWSLTLQWRQGRLTLVRSLDYFLLFLFILLSELVTTNFSSRIA
ncbi:MAG: hypothetical protein Q8N81_04565 [bacterium]|nr:hypothetical protein [bacterium]